MKKVLQGMKNKVLLSFSGLLFCNVACAAHMVKAVYSHVDGRREVREYALEESGGRHTLRLAADSVGAGVKRIEFLPSFATAKTGDDGYFVLPEGTLGTFTRTNGVYSTGEGRNYMPFTQ